MTQAALLLCVIAGAALFDLATHVAIPPLAWVALTLLLHGSRGMTPVSSLVWLWISLYAALGIGDRGVLPASGAAYLAITAAVTTTLVAPFACARFLSPWLFPVAWVACEFLRSRFTPGATWGAIAYSQYSFLPLMQVAAFVGIWGISFLIAWFAATFEWAWEHGWGTTPVLVYGVTLGLALAAGYLRTGMAPTDRRAIRTAALNTPAGLFAAGEKTRICEGRLTEREKLSRLHEWFLEGSRREARAGARLIVWPEVGLLVLAEDEAQFLGRAQRLAAEERVTLAMGMGTIHRGAKLPLENKLILIDGKGRRRITYRKSHPVMGWEAGIMQVGDGRVPVVTTGEGRIAAVICFDADFPEFVRQAGAAGTDLLVLPANDWREIKDIHFRMHAFRAIENGVTLVRAASSGISGAFDPWGRVLGVADAFAPGDRTLVAQAPAGGVRTWYARAGDWFAWLCVAAMVGGASFYLRATATSR